MIAIGNQTAFSAESPRTPFDYAVEQGFEAFEWFPDKKPWGGGWDDTDLDAATRAEIQKTARARGIRLSVHARWQVNPFQVEAWPLLERDVQLAHDLGATVFNIHLFPAEGVEAYARALTPLLRVCAKARIRLAIENTPETTPRHFNDLFAALRSATSAPAGMVGMCFDLGHANLCAATHNNYLAYFDQLDRWVPIIHLHVHENWGDADSHLPLFTGPAGTNDSGIRGFVARLRRRQYSGALILEQWPQPPALLNQARDSLRRLWDMASKSKSA